MLGKHDRLDPDRFRLKTRNVRKIGKNIILWVMMADLACDFFHIHNTSITMRLSGNLPPAYLKPKLSTKSEMNCGISQTISIYDQFFF